MQRRILLYLKDQYEMSSINLVLRMWQMRRSETLNLEQLIEHQQKRFTRLLKYVIDHSEFYRHYYQEYGVNLEKLDQVRLEDLPIIDKQVIMKNFDQLVCDRALQRADLERFVSDPGTAGKKYKGRFEVTHTSGSSGRIGIFVYGANDWTMLEALAFSRISKTRLHWPRKTRVAFMGVIDGHYAGISLTRSGPKSVVKFLPIDISWPIKKIVAELNGFLPHVLSGYASGIYLLALEQQKGNLTIKPEKIMCSADPLTENMADVIHQAFGVRPFNCYAATESIAMAAECRKHNGIHLFNDWHIFEIIKPDGRPAGPGETGNLVITNLYNYTQPLIRYRMDDSLILADKTCSCGWAFPLIKGIEGRVEEYLRFELPDGHTQLLHPFVFVEFFVPGLEKLQVVQLEKNKLRLNVVINGDIGQTTARIKDRMDVILKMNQMIGFVDYEIAVLEEIASDPKTGKFKLVVPYDSKPKSELYS
jgi:phenylacetate-CoA ligase